MKKSTKPKSLWTRVAGAVPVPAPAKKQVDWKKALNYPKINWGKYPNPRPLRKRIPRRTPKRSAQERRYTKTVLEWFHATMRRGATCPVTGDKLTPFNIQCHHIYGRRGPLLNWQPGWLAVSAKGHEWIHKNISEARRCRWYAPAGMWENKKVMEEKQ